MQGSANALELAYTLADGKEYIRTAISAGLNIAPRLSFLGHRHEFMEIASVPRDFCGRRSLASSHRAIRKADVEDTRLDVRLVAYRAGSLQQYCANNYRGDGRRIWRHAKPSHECARRRLFTLRFCGKNCAQYAAVLQEETGISQVVDPWGGSYMMESLTNEIAESLSANRRGRGRWWYGPGHRDRLTKAQNEEAAAKKQARIDRSEDVIVGVSATKSMAGEVDILEVDNDAVRDAQITRLKQIRDARDTATVTACLEALCGGSDG